MAADTASHSAVEAISGHLDTRTAALELADHLHEGLGSSCDLVLLFASYHHGAAFADAAGILRETLHPEVLLGTTTESVLGADFEMEGVAGMSALGMCLPGVRLAPWTSTPDEPIRISRPEMIPSHIGLDEEFRVAIMFADPFTTPIARLIPALDRCGGDDRPVPLVGGVASGASQPGHNVLACGDKILHAGAVGVSLSGRLAVDFIVSQGCRPIGKPLVITRATENIILELGGHPALDMAQRMAGDLPGHEQALLVDGLLVGSVIDEYRSHFGRGDFLVRSVLGWDKDSGGIAVGELPRVGQTIQFHVRDAATAREDLQLLLDAQELETPPFGGLLVTCNGRGEHLFGTPGHDISIIRDRLGEMPIAGFFAAGEIGPIGSRTFLHGHTAALTLFRDAP